MTTAINRASYKYYSGVPDTLPSGEWLLDPDLSSVSGVPPKYWKVVGETVIEMSSGEKEHKDYWVNKKAAIKDDVDKVINIKPNQDTYSRIYMFSCDFCKKETWYIESLWKTESFDANGAQTVFNLAEGSGVNSAVIDLSHGKVTDEDEIVSPSGGSYVPVVKINGAVQTEREAFETSGGHYTVDYVKGELTFLAAPPSGNTVSIDYWHSPSGHGPMIKGAPAPGKKWVIDSAEVQFSDDVLISDVFMQNVFLDYPVFDESGVLVTTIKDMKAAPDTKYKTFGNILDYTYGSFAEIPAIGGSDRGLSRPTIVLRWEYPATIELKSSLSMYFKAWTQYGRGYSGERATITIYGVEHDE